MSLPSALRSKALHFTVTAESAGDGEAAVTISTGNSDRHRDKVMPKGVTLDNYKKNPVVLFGHNYHALPVGTCTSIEATESGLKASWKWLQGDPMADRVKNAWDQGVLRAASIGFVPTKWAYDEERRGYDYIEAELLEFSIVPVPANAEAVRQLSMLGLPYDEQEARIAQLASDIAEIKAALVKAPEKAAPADDSPDFFTCEDEQTNPDEIGLPEADVRDALVIAVREMASAALDKTLAQARGRID